jgi:hypothetical protein
LKGPGTPKSRSGGDVRTSVLTYEPALSIPLEASHGPVSSGKKTSGKARISTASGGAAVAFGYARPASEAAAATATAISSDLICPSSPTIDLAPIVKLSSRAGSPGAYEAERLRRRR